MMTYIIIASKTSDQHDEILTKVFERLQVIQQK